MTTYEELKTLKEREAMLTKALSFLEETVKLVGMANRVASTPEQSDVFMDLVNILEGSGGHMGMRRIARQAEADVGKALVERRIEGLSQADADAVRKLITRQQDHRTYTQIELEGDPDAQNPE